MNGVPFGTKIRFGGVSELKYDYWISPSKRKSIYTFNLYVNQRGISLVELKLSCIEKIYSKLF